MDPYSKVIHNFRIPVNNPPVFMPEEVSLSLIFRFPRFQPLPSPIPHHGLFFACQGRKSILHLHPEMRFADHPEN
jgi:hypothetical protein